LARLLLQPANFLLLDEPTNHLDMRAKDVLLTALEEYTGTIVFVSHDRYFLDKLATRVFEVIDGEVRIYPGNYEDYMWRISGQPLPSIDIMTPAPAPTLDDVPRKDGKPRVNPLKLKKLKDRQAEIEREIEKLESALAGFEGELAVFRSAEESQRVAEKITAARGQLETLTAEWEEVTASIED
jgi:ATP-binding cassette subfamily F protein 3